MDLQNIQDQLNTEFAKSETRIIFWFDDKGEYEDEISELQLGDVKLHILDGTNWLYSKYLLNEEDKESKYLVYAAFAKPSDAENPLADMYYYSSPYYTDRVSQMSQEIGIDNRFKEHLSQYGNFWKNKHRIEKFKELGIDHYNAQTIDIGLIAVLTDVKTPNFEEVVKQMMLDDNEKYFKALDDNGLTDKFWELCEKFFGYKSEKPNIDDLSACMILTYASSTLKATVPEAMRTYILKKRNDVVVFIRNIMDNVNYQDAYDKLVERIDKSLRFVTRIQDGLKKDVEKKKDSFLQLADIFACDAFAGLDDIIIDWALEQLNDEILDAQIDGLNIAQVADQRMSKVYHYSERYKNEYTTIKYAYLMMKSVSLMEFSSDIKTLVTNYQKESYLIDSYYRWFYYAYDQIEDNSKFSDVRQRVENIYANTYLQKITPKWNENFTNEEMNATDLPKQEDFYKHYLRGYDGKQRVIVIISDAFRYECAKELFGRLELDEKCTPKIECMLSCLPSVTSVGMGSLLPHKEMQVDGSLNVTVDGQACASMEQRDKILKSYNENNVALSFDEVANANQARIRELIQGKNIVYIYHNQVDARGDKPASENEVFNACEEAVEEIYFLVRKLTSSANTIHYIITADHGFIYKRDKLSESDKISGIPDADRRYALTDRDVQGEGVASLPFSSIIGADDSRRVYFPMGSDLFKKQGSGLNYTHGGSSPQEMIIPLIDVRTEKGRCETTNAEIRFISLTRKITNLVTVLDFMQTEPVSDVVKETRYHVYFVDEKGNRISNECIYIADKKDADTSKRIFKLRFSFRNIKYDINKKYYLVAFEEKTSLEVLRHEMMIDIAFADDFGF